MEAFTLELVDEGDNARRDADGDGGETGRSCSLSLAELELQ
jgi:hypothetical protein